MQSIIKPHWNPNYLVSKIKQNWFLKSEKNCPWLAYDAVKFLKQYLTSSDVILETGSGKSTIWFSRHAGFVYSIEHHKEWFNIVSGLIHKENCNNIEYYIESRDFDTSINDFPYTHRMNSFNDYSFDMILIDGKLRDLCALIALKKVKSTGIIVIDNVERYIYDKKYVPGGIRAEEIMTENWRKFVQMVDKFRRVTFYDGISSTMVIFMNTDISKD